MKKEFESHIRNNFPNLFGANLLVANSSGVDSMVLSTLLLQCNLSFSVAYANFQLRPEAEQEAQFLQQWATENQLPFYTQKFDTAARAQKEKKSIQLMARELRYDWFESLQKKHGLDWILTAHHLNDQVETFLMHSFRGTGPKGLCGIPANNTSIMRPLLPFTKKEILAFAHSEKINWCEDTSNTSDTYRRNRIRHQVVPALEEEFTQLPNNFQKTLSLMQQQQSFVDHQIAIWKDKYWQVQEAHIRIDLTALLAHPMPIFWMHQLLAPYGFDAQEVFKLAATQSGKFLESGTHRLNKERSHLTLLARGSQTEALLFHLNGWDDFNQKGLPLVLSQKPHDRSDSNQVYLDPNTIRFPVVLRKKNPGDFMYPVGMQGRKKISKFFKDEKYTQLEKETQWLLCQESEVIWIVGRRANRKFVPTPKSTAGVLITFDA